MAKPARLQGLTTPDHWDNSAREYSAIALRQAIYLESAEAIVRLAALDRGMVVLDLACGSGVVTEALLKHPVARDLEIIAVDYSTEMLGRARSRIDSSNVRFRQCRAEELSQAITEKLDRVLCSAAFWQFDKLKALSEIRRVLKPTGSALIGIPTQDFKIIGSDRAHQENKVVWMIMEEKALRGYPTTGPRNGNSPRELEATVSREKNILLESLSDDGFTLEEVETISIPVSGKDYIDFLRIPVMAASSFLFDGVLNEETQQILNVVENELDWVEVSVPPVQWQIFVLKTMN